mmetsp:Transcript_18825/g.32157  ORF Transcript_18825/g.32157 Transcript_18825/m.32157 type:complete len:109 (+) Transcript_18825:1412-1738(+)
MKRNISPPEYISYSQMQSKGTKVLRSKRVCIIDNGVYIIINYFYEIDGGPMLGIIQSRQGYQQNIDLPKYVKVYREVTDEPQYLPEILSKENYKMNEKDKEATNISDQ